MLKNLLKKCKSLLENKKLKLFSSQNWTDFERDQKTYIIPTRFGMIYGSVCLVLFLMSFIYGNNLTYLYTFFLISLGVSTMHITNKNIDRFKYITAQCKNFFADEIEKVTLSLNNHTNHDIFNLEISFSREESSFTKVVHIPPQSTLDIQTFVSNSKRGYLEIPRVLVQSDYPFAMLRSWKKINLFQRVIVYPLKKGEPLLQNSKFADAVGQIKNKQHEGSFFQHRNFTPSDSFKRVDWKAYARSRNLLVQQKENPQNGSLEISFLDVLHIINFEDKISQLCLWISDCEKLNVPVKLDLGYWQNNSAAPNSFETCYETLALIKESDYNFYKSIETHNLQDQNGKMVST